MKFLHKKWNNFFSTETFYPPKKSEMKINFELRIQSLFQLFHLLKYLFHSLKYLLNIFFHFARERNKMYIFCNAYATLLHGETKISVHLI